MWLLELTLDMLMSKLSVPNYARVLYIVSNVFLCGFSELPCSFRGIVLCCYESENTRIARVLHQI